MATSIIVDGPALVKIAVNGGTPLQTLGYTVDGVEITEQQYNLPVKSDEGGGEAGPPVDEQFMGQIHIVRMRLVTYDEAVANVIRPALSGGTAGTVGTPGTLHIQDSKTFRLLIASTNRPRNYLRAIFKEFEVNKGVKHSIATVVAHCYKDASSILYNATTT